MHADPRFEVDPQRRFGGIARLYGEKALDRLAAAHLCVVGVGGVGSWTAEALARSGVGRLTLIDLDHVAESNINRQAHALEHTLGQAKVLAMAERLRTINPQLVVDPVEEFVSTNNAGTLLQGFDHVIDAIDHVSAKIAIALTCRARGMGLTMTGGAGGKTNPCAIRVDDLARSSQDPLLAKVRARLRRQHGYPRESRRKFGIEVVYVDEPLRRPQQACDNARGPQGLSCAGYGSSMMMTASVGLAAAARAVERLLAAARADAQSSGREKT